MEQLECRSLPSASPTGLLDGLTVDTSRYDQSHVLVTLQPGTGLTDLSAVAPGVALNSSVLDPGSSMMYVELCPGVTVEQGVAFFQAQSYVRFAQPDYVISAAVIPNDTSFGSQWGLHNTGQSGGVVDADIDAPEAWNITTGSGSVVVAVIDTGVDWTHPDLAANIWSNTDEVAGNGIDDDGNGFIDDVRGWDFVNNDNNPTDDNGHGSHVAGIIGAVGNNGIGVSGVAWPVKIMPLKFLNASGSGSTSGAIAALNYAVANGATISNNSWGGGGFSTSLFNAINSARAAGHIFVAAAGNSGTNNDSSSFYPANYNVDNIVSVASTTRTDARSSFSNYGLTTVDLGAPGSSILSTYRGGGYATLSGTSMATPFVTGAIALVRDLHPNWSYTQVISQVLNNTDPIPALQGLTITGGRLNLFKALGGQPPVDTNGPRVTSASFSGVAANTIDKLRVTFSESIDPLTFTGGLIGGDIAAFRRDGVDITGLTYTVAAVTGSNNTQFDITFVAQTAIGSYAMTIGPNIADTAGNLMNQDNDGTNGENPGDQYTATGTISSTFTFSSTDVPKNILDVATTTSVLNVNQSLTISKITVKLNVTHTWDSDLKISLKAPNGTTVVLVNRRGGSGDNFTNTVFDSSAAVSVVSGVAPFSGTYRPEQSLTAFNNLNASGTWTLIVQDLAALDVGTLRSWSITITSTNGGASIAGGEPGSPIDVSKGFKFGAMPPVWTGDAAPARLAASDSTAPSKKTTELTEFSQDAPLGEHHAATESAADAGFLVLESTGTEAKENSDWLNFDAEESLVEVPDRIEVR